MKKLTILISIFFITLSMPLAYFNFRAYRGIVQEEKAEMQYFATTLFDEIEEELAALTLREERRAVDEYSYYLSSDSVSNRTESERSPLSRFPEETYIFGYLQNNPDGSFQTPLLEIGARTSLSASEADRDVRAPSQQEIIARLKEVNSELNTLKIATISEEIDVPPIGMIAKVRESTASNLAEKYLDVSKWQTQKTRRTQETNQMQRITVEQVVNIAQEDQTQDMTDLHVEIDPMQSVLVNERDMLIFRRIMINNQVYRQGFVISASKFLNYLTSTYFTEQPLAAFTKLRLAIKDREQIVEETQTGVDSESRLVMNLSRVFPRPFSFLQATLTCTKLPYSTGRKMMDVMRVLMGIILLAGLLTIYQSVRTVVDLSERRAMFVSSVTHELKTPLTNIRMYIEMLEQGMAPTPEREEEYFRIVGSESRRLSRLIDNVLEFSRLEKKQRRFTIQDGNFDDVIREVHEIMQAKLQQEGFTLKVEQAELAPFRYDREVMVQVLLNLIENSMKFGKSSPEKVITLRLRSDGRRVTICVEDSGPGIPQHALSKVFDDFYRVENELTRTTRGTGIGLALVKKLITSLGGTVEASNNPGSGCTIHISLPVKNYKDFT